MEHGVGQNFINESIRKGLLLLLFENRTDLQDDVFRHQNFVFKCNHKSDSFLVLAIGDIKEGNPNI